MEEKKLFTVFVLALRNVAMPKLAPIMINASFILSFI